MVVLVVALAEASPRHRRRRSASMVRQDLVSFGSAFIIYMYRYGFELFRIVQNIYISSITFIPTLHFTHNSQEIRLLGQEERQGRSGPGGGQEGGQSTDEDVGGGAVVRGISGVDRFGVDAAIIIYQEEEDGKEEGSAGYGYGTVPCHGGFGIDGTISSCG